jgi:hypothetical protein
MTHLDWLPRNHTLLYNQGNATVRYLTPIVLERISIVGNSLIWYNSEFIPKHDIFNIAFEDWLDPAERTKTKITALNASETDFKIVYRLLYMGYLKKNPLVTDVDLINMGLPKHSTEKTHSRTPATLVEASADTSTPATVIINYRDQNETGTAKPKYVSGVEIIYAILDTPPVSWSQLIHSTFNTRTPARLVFKGDERGKILYFALRWENNLGEKGPWSNIYSTFIP